MIPLFKPATGGMFGGIDLSKNSANKFGNSTQSSTTIPLFKPISGGTFGGIKLDS